MNCDICDMLYDPDHVTPLLSNYKKRKVKDKRDKEIKVIMAKAAYNTSLPTSLCKSLYNLLFLLILVLLYILF